MSSQYIQNGVVYCNACCKYYTKLTSHKMCWKKYCWICNIQFETEILQQEHSKNKHFYFYNEEQKECVDIRDPEKLSEMITKKGICRKMDLG